jgi:hypothetical protein
MNLNPSERLKLEGALEELRSVIEDFARTGLSTASETTRQSLYVTFQEASRLRLLRLASTLRLANDEMAKLIRNDADFSRGRFVFFLNRTWLLARGLVKAMQNGDEATFDKLLWAPPSQPIDTVAAIVLGVVKKVAPGTFVAFDFRMRVVTASPLKSSGADNRGDSLSAGQRISWSCVFPLKPGQDVPAEAFLHLPHKQKFTASVFLEGKTVVLQNVAVALDEAGGARISLGEQSTVRSGAVVEDYERYLNWDPGRALERLDRHEASPFDLDVELQEEVVLRQWTIGEPAAREAEKQAWYPISVSGITLTGVASNQEDGKAHRMNLDALRKKKPAPLFGLLHYEKCRLMVQPLTMFGAKGMTHLMLSQDKVDRATLLKALKF